MCLQHAVGSDIEHGVTVDISSSEFTWNFGEDFRKVPEAWIPAHGVAQSEGCPLPDENGHIPGEKGHVLFLTDGPGVTYCDVCC